MRAIDSLLNEYGESHQNTTNKMIHWICIPQIMFSLVGLLWSIPVPELAGGWVNIGSIVIALSTLYYVRLSLPLFVGFLGIAALLIIGNFYLFQALDKSNLNMFIVSFAIFFSAWAGQFYGHKIEGKKPSFLKDLQFLLIGPAWLLHFIYKKLGLPY